MALRTGVRSDNDGVNELAINPLTEEDNKDWSRAGVKYGHLEVTQWQKLAEKVQSL